MPDGQKVGDAYISLYADIDRRQWDMAGRGAADDFGIGFGKTLPDAINKNFKDLEKSTKKITQKIKIDTDVSVDHDPIQRAGRDLGTELGMAMQESVRPILKSFPGQVAEIMGTPLGPALLAVGVPVMSFVGISLGAALGGAILVGLSGAVVAGGLIAVFKDPRALQAASDFGNSLMSTINNAVQPLVSVVIPIMDKLKEAFNNIQFGQIFQNLIPGVAALGQAIQNLAPVFNEIFLHLSLLSGPLMSTFGSFLDKFGPAFSSFIDKLASVLPGLQAGFTFFGNTVIGILQFAGDLLQHFGAMFETVVKIMIAGADAMSSVLQVMAALGAPVGDAAAKLHDMADNMRNSLEVTSPLTSGIDTVTASTLTMAQALGKGIDNLNALKQAMDQYENPLRDVTDATEKFNQGELALLATNTQGTEALSLKTKTGLENRDALEAMILSNNDLTLAEIANGVSVEDAVLHGKNRIANLIDQNYNQGVTRDSAYELNKEYGLTPAQVETLINLKGYQDVVDKLNGLKLRQISLWKNTSIEDAKSSAEFQGHASGGYIHGPGTGTSDSIPAMLSKGEYVVKASSVSKYGSGLMGAINSGTADIAHYATGGFVSTGKAVGTGWDFPLDVSGTFIDEHWADGPQFGGGGNLGSGGRSVEKLIKMVRDAGLRYTVNSTDRPGDPGYHGQGKAVDFGGDMNGIAKFFMAHAGQMLEVIHGDSNSFVKNGKVVGPSFYGAQTVAEHASWGGNEHVHTAMNGDASGEGGGNLGTAIGGAKASAQLASWISQAAKYVGIEWYDGLVTLIMRESGGNPGSVNLSDSNAMIGTPSMGLMQTIGPTFAKFRNSGLANNAFDPVANIVAGMNYIHSRYGSLFNVQQAHADKPAMGYDNGGWLPPGMTLVNNSSGVPEAVLTGNQWDNVSGGGTSEVYVDVYLDGEPFAAKIQANNKAIANELRRGRGRAQ